MDAVGGAPARRGGTFVVRETPIRAWQDAGAPARDPHEVGLTSQDAARSPDGAGQRPSTAVIADVIGALGEEHRVALYETYVRGRTVRQAAQALGIPESTVKSRVYHAMKILRRASNDWNRRVAE